MEKKNKEIDVKSKILKTKNEDSVIAYLGFLQAVIDRMNTNSSNIKALIAVVYTIYITILVSKEQIGKYLFIGIGIAIIGVIMDVYYLAFERMYRKKYNKCVNDLNQGTIDVKEIYNMNPKSTDLKYEIYAVMLEAAKSPSIVAYYMLFVFVTIFLKFI